MKLNRLIWSLIILLIIFSYPIYYHFDTAKYSDDKQIKIGMSVENNTLYNFKVVEKKLDRKLNSISIFQKITENPKTEDIQEFLDEGYVVLLTLEPWNGSEENEENYIKYEPKQILNGSIDNDILKWNQAIKSLKYKKGNLAVRISHEINGDWYPWAAFWRNNTIENSVNEYKYINDGISDNKILKVWGINRKTFGYDDRWISWEKFYPGNEYTDIVGVSLYNRYDTNWMSFTELYRIIHTDLIKLNISKPVWISELSSISKGGNKAEWISETFDDIKNIHFEIEMIFWFNENKMFNDTIKDWEFDSTPESAKTFKEVVKYKNLRRT